MTITAAADGSALGNPGPAGWAWYVDDLSWSAGGWKHATNNQGELKAVLELFRATRHIDDDLLVLCDSQYVINCITKWMRGWKAKGWRKADGKPVMNVDLLKEIDAELVGRRYRFEWVKGHANHPLNEAADVRARGASESYQRGLPVRNGPGYTAAGAASAARATSAVVPTPAAAAVVSARASTPASVQDGLFSFTDVAFDLGVAETAADARRVTVTLSADEYARLEQRARVRSLSIEDCLRSLI